MTIHREGYKSIGIAALLFGVINLLSFSFLSGRLPWLAALIFIVTLFLFLFIVSFFRLPKRILTVNDNAVIAPADGKVVVIEEITDTEYFNDRRIQVSIFMSPANVHVNLYPMNGIVKYSKYHKGLYLVAWHPKSSTENERHSIVVENKNNAVLVKQIAGALAKRICNYAQAGKQVKQNEEMGFIKFGSRVDLLLPLHANIQVNLDDKVKGGVTTIATF